MPATSSPRRPIRRTAVTAIAADTTDPRARAVPCRPATALEVPCSTRSSGTLGPKEYRNHPQTDVTAYTAKVRWSRCTPWMSLATGRWPPTQSDRSTTWSMHCVSARTSSGSIAGNVAMRSWLRPSLR